MGDPTPWNDQSHVSIFFRWWWERDRWKIVLTWSEAAQCAVYIISGCQKLDEPLLMKHIDHENYITTFCTFSVNVERLEWPTGRNKQYGPLLKSRRFKKRDWICSPISSKKSRNSNYGCEFLFKQLSRANIAHYSTLFICQRDFVPLIWISHLFGGDGSKSTLSF